MMWAPLLQVTNVASLFLLPLLPGASPAPAAQANTTLQPPAGSKQSPAAEPEAEQLLEVEMLQGTGGLDTHRRSGDRGDSEALLGRRSPTSRRPPTALSSV